VQLLIGGAHSAGHHVVTRLDHSVVGIEHDRAVPVPRREAAGDQRLQTLAKRRPISSSITCGGGSTCRCMARQRATRTAVLSGASVVSSLIVDPSLSARAPLDLRGVETQRSGAVARVGPLFLVMEEKRVPPHRSVFYVPD
jgi:hypothetical protein